MVTHHQLTFQTVIRLVIAKIFVIFPAEKRRNMSELVWGIKNGDLDQVKDIVQNKGINLNEEIDGRPPILYAADYGQTEVIKYLISAGADVNSKDKHGITAILAAIWEGHKDCIKILLDHGASKSGVAPDGTTYLENAANSDVKQLLV